jgi:hypothetical protein
MHPARAEGLPDRLIEGSAILERNRGREPAAPVCQNESPD